jgi:hypothetical protein
MFVHRIDDVIIGSGANPQTDRSPEAADENNAEWVTYLAAQSNKPKTKFSAREFLRRLTLDEKVALKTSDDIQVQIWYDELIAADFVDIEDPDVEDAIDYGIFKGIFTEPRKTQLLTPE